LLAADGISSHAVSGHAKETGYIALQIHDFLSRTQFRHLEVRKLP